MSADDRMDNGHLSPELSQRTQKSKCVRRANLGGDRIRSEVPKGANNEPLVHVVTVLDAIEHPLITHSEKIYT